jgi:hypothetical protein
MTTPGDLKGACSAVAAPEGPNWREACILINDSPTMSYGYLVQICSMNSQLNSQRTILSRNDTDWPARTERPFPRESIRSMMRGGREGLEVMGMGMLSTEMVILLEDLAC